DGGGGRRDGDVLRQRGQRRRRHVLELGGDGVAAAGHLGQRALVVIGRAQLVVRGGAGGAVLVGVEHQRVEAQRLRGVHEHAAQLAAAQHAQRGAGRQTVPLPRR